MGENLKYPIHSEALEKYLADVRADRTVISLLRPLNIYLYLTRDFFGHKSVRINDPIFHALLQISRFNTLGDLIINSSPPGPFLKRRPGYHNRSYLRRQLENIRQTRIESRLNENLRRNFSHLDKALELAQSRGLNFVIFELPYSKTFRTMYEKELADLDDHLRLFLRNHPGVKFARIDYELYDGKEVLFFDHGHVMDEGRKFFYPYMMNILQNEFHLSSRSS
jgi:hypothetical protein